MMRKILGLVLLGLFLPCFRLLAEDGPATLSVLRKKADSLFGVNYQWIVGVSPDHFKEWLGKSSVRWERLVNGAGLGREERHVAEVYGKAKVLVAKFEFIFGNSYGLMHAEALSDWAQEGQDLEEPALAELDHDMAYEYVRAYLETKFVLIQQRSKFNYEFYDGRLKAMEFLLQSKCPDAVKHAYVNFMLPVDLKRHHISPEIAILEPYIRQGFRDPVLVHYYDSMLNWHHRLDRGNPAPDFTLSDHNGKKVRLSDLRGKKVVIDCWATWCGGCIANMPAFDSLAHGNKDPNTVFFSASIDDIDSAGVSVAWRNYITGHHFDPAAHLNGPKEDMAAFRAAYGITGVPHYYIIDAAGKIVSLHCISPRDPEFIWDLKN